jgi:hypothetical protein
VGVIAALAACGPAHAFYWQGWPGSQLRIPPTLILTPPQSAPISPPPETVTPPPPLGPPVPVNQPPGGTPSGPPVGPPEHTPEPATGLLGLVGVGALAAVRKWRKKASQ